MASMALAFDILARDKGASRTFDRVGDSAERAGRKGKSFGSAIKGGVALAAGATAIAATGIVAGLTQSINKAMDYDKTMRLVGTTLGATGRQQKALGDLALKMGRDTVYSAAEAGDAMLELAKGGMTAATIQGGALAATMTLAAAGGIDMGSAAAYVSNALNTFGLKAKDANKVAAALAGGANASSASVESLGMGLSQVGASAKNARLSVQETVAALSALDAAGIKGSDAGTSLKTMLQRLIAPTGAGAAMMTELGLSVYDARGAIVPFPKMLDRVAKATQGMTEKQRNLAMSTIFGSDAIRSGLVLTALGSKGLVEYTKATSDQAAAQRLANEQMKGASGAWESFKGSVETLAITVGVKMLPVFTSMVGRITSVVNVVTEKAGPAIGRMVSWFRDELWPALQNGYRTIMPGLQKAISIISGGVEGNTVTWKEFGDLITRNVIPTIAKITNVYLPAWARQIRIIIETVKTVWKVLETLLSVQRRVASALIAGFVGVTRFGARMLDALSNVPGFGWAADAAAKLRRAANEGERVKDAINGIPRTKTIDLYVRTRQTGRITMPNGATVNVGMRAKGGPVRAGQPYAVGDNPDGSWNKTTELFWPNQSGRILNQKQISKAMGAGPVGATGSDYTRLHPHDIAAIVDGIAARPNKISAGSFDAAMAARL